MTAAPRQTMTVQSSGTSPSSHPAARFQQTLGAGYRAIAVADLAAEELRQIVDSPETRLDGRGVTVIKRGRSALVVKTTMCLLAGRTEVAYKRMGSRSIGRRLARGLSRDRAIRNFHIGHELLRLGVATPCPLLAVSPRWRVFLRPPLLATEWIDGAVPIDTFLRNTAVLSASKRRLVLRETANTVGRLIGALHAHGFAHRDLKAGNVLVRARNESVEVFLIDLDGVSRHRLLSWRTRLANLSRLVIAMADLPAVTPALQHRVLSAYLGNSREKGRWKNIWRHLRKISRIRLARKRRAAHC